MKIHKVASGKKAVTAKIHELLERVTLSPASRYIDRYPTDLSGGQRQRIAIAKSLAVNPKVLLADEPTSMLDASIRLEVLNLLTDLRESQGLAVLYITHDIASARYISDRINVMYGGRIIESGPTEQIVNDPVHPYTRLLIDAAPDPAHYKGSGHSAAVSTSSAAPVDNSVEVVGCRFANRCPLVRPECTSAPTPRYTSPDGREVLCVLGDERPDFTPPPTPRPRHDEKERSRMISPRMTRRSLLGALGVGTVTATAAACSGSSGGSSDAGGAEGAAGGLFVVGTAVTATNQFAKNFNRYGGGDTAPGLDLVYEPLFRLSSKDGGQLLPMLAESAEHSEDGTEVTYHLRKGVTWSDGEPFPAKDVLFTLGSLYGTPNPEPAEDEFVWLSAPIETPDDHTVVIKYNSDQRQQEVNLALYYPIVPAHVYQDGDKLEFPQDIMDDPIGTGPAALESFDTQLVTYTMRDDYWGGTSSVGEVQFVPSGQAGNIETQISQGQVDFAEGGAPGVVNGFLDMAETNNYVWIADGASQGIIFMTARPESPLYDVEVRKALRAAIDYDAVREASGIGYTLPNCAGVDPVMNESLQQPEFNEPMTLDPEAAKKALEASDWTVNAAGNLEKDGKEHPLSLQIQNDNATFMVTMPIVVSNWEEHLGIKVTFDPKPKDVMDTILATGDFDLVATGLGYPGSPWSDYTMYDQPILPIEEETHNGNWGRWDWGEEAEEKMSILVSTLNTPETQDKIAEGVQGVQQAFLEQAPHAPVQGGGTGVMYSEMNWTGFPDPADVDYFPRVGGMGNMTQLLMAIKPVG